MAGNHRDPLDRMLIARALLDHLGKNGLIGHPSLDAKYRDLSSKTLPREMLYQLAIYALSQPGNMPTSIILYPTLTGMPDQVVLFNDVVRGAPTARVVLRAVNLLELENTISSVPGQASRRQRQRLAERYVLTACRS